MGLIFTVLISLFFGGSDIKGVDTLNALFGSTGVDETTKLIIWKIRIPRILLGVIVGAGLALSGSVFQGVLRNPLADSYTLGISGGAAFGVTLSTILGVEKIIGYLSLPLGAFAGAGLATFLVYLIATRKRFSVPTLVLSGVILSFLFSSLVLFILAILSADKVQNTLVWLMGDLSSAETGLIKVVSILVVISSIILIFFSRELDILTLGEEKATHLGIEVETIKKIFFFFFSFITGVCVSASGVIGFVGLVVPHLMRKIVGTQHLNLFLSSILSGAMFLVLSDTVARTIIAPIELPVGVITGIIGGIFFMWFLMKTDKWNWF